VFRRYYSPGFWLLAGLLMTSRLLAADEAKVLSAIQKGRAFLNSKLQNSSGGPKSLAAYALVKTGTPTTDPAIQAALQHALTEIESHYGPGKPRYGHEFAYTVPCHMFLLEAVDAAKFKPQLESAAAYLVEHQQENGSWFYTEVPVREACDTSQAQFALLGLWAAYRAGVDVPLETWQKAGQWFLKSQREDGGFLYQPFAATDQKNQKVTLSITLTGAGSLMLLRQVFYPGTKLGDDLSKPAQPKKKYGVLEHLEDEQERQRRKGEFNISAAALDKGVSRALKVIDQNFRATSHFQMYLFYAMERLAALLDSETIGQHDWYGYASDELLRLQTADGSWSDTAGPVPATSFAIMCLNRTTAKILGKSPPAKRVGGGLLAGARGLPTDLSQLQGKDGRAAERKSKGDVDDLLAELENVQNVSVADVQQAILENVNLDEPEQLVGEIDRLRRLAADPRAEVRRTALWAIGRSGEIRLAPLLIAALRDPETDVVREASYALIVLARKPTGLVDDKGNAITVEPLEGVDEDAPDDAVQESLKRWVSLAEPAWRKWYLSVRPYDERDDRQHLQRKR
jgi:hypothetical protein